MSTKVNNKIANVICSPQIIKNDEEVQLASIKYEENGTNATCDKCTLLKNLKGTIANIYTSTLKNARTEGSGKPSSNFCELDIFKNLKKNCENCRNLKSDTSVQTSHGRKKHKQHINRSGSQIETRLINSSTTAELEQKSSRKSRSLGRNTSTSVNVSDTSKEDVLKWKQEIETLEIKRQIFTAIGQNRPKDYKDLKSSKDRDKTSKDRDKSSKDRDKSSNKHHKKKVENINGLQKSENYGDHISDSLENMEDVDVPKKDMDGMDKAVKLKTHRSKKKRNNSPNVLVQDDLENGANVGQNTKSIIPDILISSMDSTFPKLLNSHGEDIKKDRNGSGKDAVAIEGVNNQNNINVEKGNLKEIIDVFKKTCKTDKGSKSKRKHKEKSCAKEDQQARKHKSKDSEKRPDKVCSKHSKSRKTVEGKLELDEENHKLFKTSKSPLLFGVDYLSCSQALRDSTEEDNKLTKDKLNSVICRTNKQDVCMRDRKEISFSNLNLSPVIDQYAKNKSYIDTLFNQCNSKRLSKDVVAANSKLSDEFSVVSDTIAAKEKSMRRHRQDRAKHYFGSHPKITRLINQTTNHLVSDENLIEVSTKILANDLVKSSVEGIEPPRKIVNNSFQRKPTGAAQKNDNQLHTTFLEPVVFPDSGETTKDKRPAVDDKIEPQPQDKKEVLPTRSNSSKLRTERRKSKISVLYEHSSNSARRKELRNKICNNNQGSKPNLSKNKAVQDKLNSIRTVCTNPDLTRRISLGRDTVKSKKCAKCHGTKKVVPSRSVKSILASKKIDVAAAKNDKCISADLSGDTSPNRPINKEKKPGKSRSSKNMCTVDTQTDLTEYVGDKASQNDSRVAKINKQCSPIVLCVPGVHKSDINVSKEDDVGSAKELKPSAYHKLQEAVMSLFHSAEMTDPFTNTKACDLSSANKQRDLKSEPVRPVSPIKPIPAKNAAARKAAPPEKVSSSSPRSRCSERSGIPKPYKKPAELKSNDCSELPKIGKQDEAGLPTPEGSATKRIDMKGLQSCIEDLISVLNGIKMKQAHDVDQTGEDKEEIRSAKSKSFDSIRKQEKRENRRAKLLNYAPSSTSVDSKRNLSEIRLSYKTKSRQSRKADQRRKRAKSSHKQLREEKELRRVFRNRNCHGSSSFTQVSSSASDVVHVSNENDFARLQGQTLCGRNFLSTQHENSRRFSRSMGADDSDSLMKQEPVANVQQQVRADLLGVCPDMLRKLPSPSSLLQKPEAASQDYRSVMDQLVYMFSQKPFQRNVRDGPSPITSSDFSADSLEQSSYKCRATNRNMPPKNCDFFVYATTVELDDKAMKRNLTGSTSAESSNMKTFASFRSQNKLNSTSSVNNTTSRSSHKVASQDSGYGTPGKRLASPKNFFKKGGSLLDLFRHKKLVTSNEESASSNTSKCGTISETSSQNLIGLSDQKPEGALTDFSPAQYWFSICPQKENSLETVHEGVQATSPTAETSTMKRWTDLVLNQCNQTKASKHKEEGESACCGRPGCPMLASKGKQRRLCSCKKESNVVDPASLDVANYILNALLDQVIDIAEATDANAEPEVKLSDVKVDGPLKPEELTDMDVDDSSDDQTDVPTAEPVPAALPAALPAAARVHKPLLDHVIVPPKQSDNLVTMKAEIKYQSPLSDKERFENLLSAYEKEDSVAERLSMDEQFFNKKVGASTTSVPLHESNSAGAVDTLAGRKDSDRVASTTHTKEPPYDAASKQKSKGNRFRKMFQRNKGNVKQIMPEPVDNPLLKQKDSVNEIFQDNPKSHQGLALDGPKKSSSRSKDMRFIKQESKHPSPRKHKKNPDCAPVEAEDIGACFARGFRPDNLALSGDACFNFNKQDKFVLTPNMTNTQESIIDFSERQTPLDYLLALGFMVDEASNALKDEDIRSRLLAAITEARVWINKITTTQGTLLYLVSYKTHPKTMRYFLQLVEAIINNRINNAIKLNGFLKVLERVEEGELNMITLLGADKFEDEENEEKVVKKQLRELFATVYSIAEKEGARTNSVLTKDSITLLRVLAAKYRAGLHPHLELIASYIGQNLIKNEIQLEAAMIYLSRLDTAEVKLKEFEAYCAIRCDDEDAKDQ